MAALSSEELYTDDVSEWLRTIHLGDYCAAFHAAGYDDLDFIREHGLSNEDCDAIAVNKLGHRRKLLAAYGIHGGKESEKKNDDPESSSSANDSDDSSEEGSESESVSESNEYYKSGGSAEGTDSTGSESSGE